MKDNTLMKVRPDLFYEWNFIMNDELGLDIYKITKGSKIKAWWECLRCKSSYDASISNRLNNRNCPYCSGRKVNHTNSLAELRPDLADDWHPTMNDSLTPNDVVCNSNKKVHWLCKNKHPYSMKICHRNNNSGCPYCVNYKVLIGYNDMWTTNPKLASLLANPEDGYKYAQNSHKKTNWVCPDCDESIKNKTMYEINYRGLVCSRCSDFRSYPEKIMYELLRAIGVDFRYDESFHWAEGKRYDFYLPKYNVIIETHGIQHYENTFNSMKRDEKPAKTADEENYNDNYKRELALENKINDYIEIDCRYSELSYLKDAILGSELNDLFDLEDVNWESIHFSSQKSLYVQFLNLWNMGLSLKEISEATKVTRDTISKSLRSFEKVGKCVYDSNRGNIKRYQETNRISAQKG